MYWTFAVVKEVTCKSGDKPAFSICWELVCCRFWVLIDVDNYVSIVPFCSDVYVNVEIIA